MDELRQIVTLLDGYKLRNIDVLGNDDSKSRYTEFYRLLKDEIIMTDEQAAIHFYGPKAKPTDVKFRVFKGEFKERLLNTLLFIDHNNSMIDEYEKILYKSTREWTAIEILFKRTLGRAATPYAERLLATCIKYEITDLTVKISERLKNVYASSIGNKKKYQEYRDKFWHYKGVLDAEYLAKDAFHELRIEVVNSTHYKPELAIKAKALLDDLAPCLDKYKSTALHHFAFLVESFMYQTKLDYQNTLEASDRAIAFMRQKPFGLNNSISIFQNQKTIALLMLRRYEECKEALEIGLSMQEYGSFNWFTTMEEKMMLAFHTGDHTEGYDTYFAVTKVKQFKDLKGHSAEMWQMFKVYLHIFSALGKTPIVDKKDVNDKGYYKIDKIFNDFDVSNDDKKGMNLTILIAKVVLTIVDKNEKEKDKLDERIEALKKYLVRNITKEDAAGYRANQFIKVLTEISNSGLNPTVLERNTRALVEDIASVPYNIVEAAYKVEVVPYDELWGDLLKTFGNKPIVGLKN